MDGNLVFKYNITNYFCWKQHLHSWKKHRIRRFSVRSHDS